MPQRQLQLSTWTAAARPRNSGVPGETNPITSLLMVQKQNKVSPRPRATSRPWHLHSVDPALGLEFHLFVGRHLTCHSRCTCLMELWQRKLHVADVADVGRCLQLQKPSAVKPGQVCCRVTTTSASLSTSSSTTGSLG